jgi:hypothetical protein
LLSKTNEEKSRGPPFNRAFRAVGNQ